MQLSEIMTRQPHFLQMDQSVYVAAEMMRDANLGFLPICDAEGQVLGTLTDRDIVVRIVAGQRSSDTPVRDIMSADVVACPVTEDVHRAEEMMQKHQISRLVCVDASNKLVGVVGLADLAERDDAEHAQHVVAGVKAAGDNDSMVAN